MIKAFEKRGWGRKSFCKRFFSPKKYLIYTSQATASLGIFQSPLGEKDTEPTLGPSGSALLLNCWVKKRRIKVFSHFSITAFSNCPTKAAFASRRILSGVSP